MIVENLANVAKDYKEYEGHEQPGSERKQHMEEEVTKLFPETS